MSAERSKAKPAASSWAAHFERERARYSDGEARLPAIADPSERQRQLTRMGNAAYGAGLALLMQGGRADAADWLARAAERYRESYADAPAGSWGRPIGAVKARLLAGDRDGARAEAVWALAEHTAESESPIGRYAACLALLVLERDGEAAALASSLRGRPDFPGDVADALEALASHEHSWYERAIAAVLESFERRNEFLEDVPVADTVEVLQVLADARELAAGLGSPFLFPSL